MSVAARVVSAVGSRLEKTRAIPRMWVAAASTGILILLLPLLFPLDGRTHADWLQFLGRFHPLLVHLPIGLIVLWPLLEIGGPSVPPFGKLLALCYSSPWRPVSRPFSSDCCWPMAAAKLEPR